MKNFGVEQAVKLMSGIVLNPTQNIGKIGLLGCALAAIGSFKTAMDVYPGRIIARGGPSGALRDSIGYTYVFHSASFLSISLGYALRDVSSYASLGLIAFGSIGSLINFEVLDKKGDQNFIPLPFCVILSSVDLLGRACGK